MNYVKHKTPDFSADPAEELCYQLSQQTGADFMWWRDTGNGDAREECKAKPLAIIRAALASSALVALDAATKPDHLNRDDAYHDKLTDNFREYP